MMQKVAKERLAVFKPQKLESPSEPDLESLEYLHYLICNKENKLFSELGLKLMKVSFITRTEVMNYKIYLIEFNRRKV